MATNNAWTQKPTGISRGGATTITFATTVDADIAACVGVPHYVLINLGANDVGAAMVENDVKTAYGYILDAYHTAWPRAWIGVMQVWRRDCDDNCDLFNSWLGTIVAARSSWAHLGPDERIFLEGGDDGATYTVEGVHPNAAGYALTAAGWKTAMGY